ncbi:hypothetical protein FBD94_16970 [Pedobacter hiemivivus]|uniref:Uncharacterized protein n=2 Tax=Pedobacter hiemivivus TaxID=2530454 RepID=A0A4R0NAN2_9SPHI|nr:hypothetical protein EZ444_10310 [Pedobacter hiemivivus]TKC59336.1 hypothetical protein FBD94_16970 [Pedobacter hiemivivus]
MILVIFSLLGMACYGQSMDLESIRANYQKAVSDKKLCHTMIKGLSTGTESSVHLTYLGAFQMIWAKHIINPISKLKTFNTGKKKIEAAVMADPINVEIRILRLSIQKNSPAFLGYHKNIEEDQKFIQANNKNITSTHLRNMMEALI